MAAYSEHWNQIQNKILLVFHLSFQSFKINADIPGNLASWKWKD